MKSLFSAAVLSAGLFTLVALVKAQNVSLAQKPTAGAQSVSASILVRTDKTLGPVNRKIFGHNIEASDSRGVFSKAAKIDPMLVDRGQGTWDPAVNAPVPDIARRFRELGVGMLRYPGGCLAHNWNWKQCVGPLSERPDWKFGLEEYLRLCRELGAEPMITVSDYVLPADEMPRHAAELVEYLNAPATPDHPWAMKRKESGHAEPHGVRYFELGNESEHGSHNMVPRRVFSGEQYADYAIATAKAMRAVDPSIKIGIVTVPGNGIAADHSWNMPVYRKAGPIADFVVVHFYHGPHAYGIHTPEEIGVSCLAVGEQIEDRLATYRRIIQEQCGRDLPLAITEYNIGAVQDKPVPFRFSFGAGLMSADLMRIALNPENHILSANYWQIINGYWGMLRTSSEQVLERPAYPLFRLWGQHFGQTLCDLQVNSPRAGFPGYSGVLPARGTGKQGSHKTQNLELAPISLTEFKGHDVSARLGADGVLAVRLNGVAKDQYIDFTGASAKSAGDIVYRLTYEARFTPDDVNGPGAVLGLGLCDSRGWDKTNSAVAVTGAESARDWQRFSGTLGWRPDTPGVKVLVRIEQMNGPVRGLLEVRNIQVDAGEIRIYPEYPEITASSSLSADGNTLYLIVFNKSATRDIETTIQMSDFKAASARRWEVAAPLTVTANVQETRSQEPLPVQNGGIKVLLPAHSMTAIEVYKTAQ